MIDIIGGHTQLAVGSVLAAMPHLKSGKLKALGVGSTSASVLSPMFPPSTRAGLPGYQSRTGGASSRRPERPPRSSKSCTRPSARCSPRQAQAQLANEGAEFIKMSTADFGKFIERNWPWGKVVKESGITLQ